MSLTIPYLTLQALGLGLTYEDISIIYGISPVIALAASPTSGKQLKFECVNRSVARFTDKFFLKFLGLIGNTTQLHCSQTEGKLIKELP